MSLEGQHSSLQVELYPWPLSWREVKTIWAASDWSQLFGPRASSLKGVGELWLNDDRPAGSAVSQGPLAGRLLAELISAAPAQVLGPRWAPLGRLPLLLKFIATADWLSVQVHPARGPKVKFEAWHILSARGEENLVLGLRPGLDRPAVEEATRSGGWRQSLNFVSPRAGQSFYVPAGLIHALGPGLVLFEIQQNEDITFRFYDWDRLDSAGQPRQLHLTEALAAMRPELSSSQPTRPISLACPGGRRTYLVACRFFLLCRLDLNQPHQAETGEELSFLTCLQGSGTILGRHQRVRLAPGSTVLLPAGLGEYRIEPEGQLSLLESSAPDLASRVIAPLRSAGFSQEEILGLAGQQGPTELGPALATAFGTAAGR